MPNSRILVTIAGQLEAVGHGFLIVGVRFLRVALVYDEDVVSRLKSIRYIGGLAPR